jgi:very-short-patch-repair endonuclease
MAYKFPKRRTTEEFLRIAEIRHEGKYDYSHVNYITAHIKIEISCHRHGIFLQTPASHLNGNGCPKCKSEHIGNLCRNSTEYFIKKAIEVHQDKYDYSCSIYANARTPLNIRCKTHDIIFKQSPNNHISGKKGCPLCGDISTGSKRRKTQEEYLIYVSLLHNNKYDYSLVKYTGIKNKIWIICPIHGKFLQIAESHYVGHGCPTCDRSSGEIQIARYLQQHNIQFFEEYKFQDCYYKRALKFDFYIPQKNILIEFDGIQHFEPTSHFGGDEAFKQRLQRDIVKNEYCNRNHITLFRIKYTDDIYTRLNSLFMCKEIVCQVNR